MFSVCFLGFPYFGFQTDFLMEFLDDSAWFCLEKLKKHVFQPKTLKLHTRILPGPDNFVGTRLHKITRLHVPDYIRLPD